MAGGKVIGVLGGVGPQAGIDLVSKIFRNTDANTDQDHLRVILISESDRIVDRTQFLLGETDENPASVLAEVVAKLRAAGAEVVGIPCNTAHAPSIFGEIKRAVEADGDIALVNMVEAITTHVVGRGLTRLGVLGTNGSYVTRLHRPVLEEHGLEVIYPDEDFQTSVVHEIMYNKEWGVKSTPDRVDPRARHRLDLAIWHLKDRGAEAVLLGCTELPLALSQDRDFGILIVDGNEVLARALVQRADPGKLKKV